jgi:sulfotransferase
MNIHFISGLPRSGSTLLAGILRQNPSFHAAMTSPVFAMYKALEGAMNHRNGAITDEQRRDVLEQLFESYYDTKLHMVVFDTNRGWCAKLPALTQLFPKARVICCVREVSWIMDSFERLMRKNAFELSGIFDYKPGGTVFTRVNQLASSDGVVGHALDAIKEAYYGEQSGKLIMVEYRDLAAYPETTIRRIYRFLEKDYFKHDFDNVEYSAEEYDRELGTPGLHTVRGKVEFIERKTILPPELFKRFENDCFWRK